MKTRLLLAICLIILTMTSGCMYAVRYDGTYEGRVVDADTREPIEGAVVLGTWYVRHHNVAGGYGEYYDARETVTDKNGEFAIPGQGLRIMSNLEPMSVLIFKAGYAYIGSVAWNSLTFSDYYRERIKWEGDRAIFPLKKLTMEERKKQGGPPMETPEKKMPLMLKEINKDRIEQGLDAVNWGGK